MNFTKNLKSLFITVNLFKKIHWCSKVIKYLSKNKIEINNNYIGD